MKRQNKQKTSTPKKQSKAAGMKVATAKKAVTLAAAATRPKIKAGASVNDVQAVKDAIASIRQTLTFLVGIAPADVRHTFKLGDARWPLVQVALKAVQDNPSMLPPSFDADDFAATVALFDELGEMQTVVNQLISDLNDTHTAVGGKAMQYLLQVKKLVDANLNSTPGLKTVAAQLVFSTHASSTPTPTPAPASPSN